MDQASPVGETEVQSDGEQSTDTDEEGVEGSTMLMDKDSPIPLISFEADKNTGNFPFEGERPIKHTITLILVDILCIIMMAPTKDQWFLTWVRWTPRGSMSQSQGSAGVKTHTVEPGSH